MPDNDDATAPRRPTEVVRLLIEALNDGDFATAETFIAPDAVNHAAPPGTEAGVKGFRGGWEMLRSAFPDFHFTLEHSVESGDTVSSRYTNRGTQDGEFLGQPATGRSFEALGLDMVRIRGGQVVEHWALFDVPQMLAQLGLESASGQ
jgi:predicted ester cyclase